MEQQLWKIGLNPKEIKVYLYLIEYGISGASEVAKHISLPKSSVNFLADNLWRRWFLRKSFRWNTSYYEADISLLETSIAQEIKEKGAFLEEVIPKLRDKNKNVKSSPKIVFFHGVESCKKAYWELLKVKDVFYELGAHEDLANTFWWDFMNDFIAERVKRKIFCDSLWSYGEVEAELQKSDAKEFRSLMLFPESFGTIGSSIAIYEDKVLILNLCDADTWVRIENKEFAETMKTIFRICKGN